MFAMGEEGEDKTEPCAGDGYLDGYNELNVITLAGGGPGVGRRRIEVATASPRLTRVMASSRSRCPSCR